MNKLFTFILFLFFYEALFAQCTAYPNIGFEQGNHSVWKDSLGCNPPCAWSSGTPANYIQIVPPPDTLYCTDPLNPVLFPAPNCGNFSAYIYAGGCEATKLSYPLLVSFPDTMIIYAYAKYHVGAGHSPPDQNYFNINVIDPNGNIISQKYLDEFTSLPYDTGCSPAIIYFPWNYVAVNLSQYVGQIVVIEFTVAGCRLCGHTCEAWIDVKCGNLTAVSNLTQFERFIYIYPNPSTTIFSVGINSIEKKFLNYEIKNIVGQIILSKQINEKNFSIDLSSQPNGIYLLSIKTSTEVVIKKLIKN